MSPAQPAGDETLMAADIRDVLETAPVAASAPCRIDMGGTLDLDAFSLPLRHLEPSTFNIAIDRRTRVRLHAYRRGRVRVESRGFEAAEFDLDQAPFDHPLGLVFAVTVYFRAVGVRIEIDSSSPPRSALGGSSAAAVALIAAFSTVGQALGRAALLRRQMVILAHALEQSAAGMPCGRQDQLAAAFGGVNQWIWQPDGRTPYRRRIVKRRSAHKRLAERLLLAYCGAPHESRDVNSLWLRQFLSGRLRKHWAEIVHCTRRFVQALQSDDLTAACAAMNRETVIRRELTPEVLDAVGSELVAAAVDAGCGARFTGAGGGGCVWALCPAATRQRLKRRWQNILATRLGAGLLEFNIDAAGVKTGNG
jgi:D-glycero-alpha-D-manno-heptose-7-phosphate kinase